MKNYNRKPLKNLDNEWLNATTPILTKTSVSQKRKWISLVVLLFINVINYMDRLTVAAVLEVILYLLN